MTRRAPAVRPHVTPGNSAHRVGYLPTLDGWRAVAVALVLVFHSNDGPRQAWWQLYPIGHLGVGIFFALSGFLICSRLLAERERHGGWNLRRFYIRRTFRIIPLAWVVIGTLACLRAGGLPLANPTELWCCLGFVRNYFPRADGGGYYTSHFWSLAVEEHFYLMFPLGLVLAGPRRAVVIFPLVSLSIAALRLAGPAIIEASGGRLPPGLFFFTRTHVRLDALLWGCWWALLFHRRPALTRRLLGAPALVACLALVTGALMTEKPLTVFAVTLPPLVVATATHPQWWLSLVLEVGVLRWVGRLSYGVYLWQQLFFVQTVDRLVPSMSPWQSFPFNAIAVLALAATTYYLVERPMIGLGHRLARPRAPGVPAS